MLKVISLFSGGGGLDLGFINAGFEVVWAVDNNMNAVETYKRNIGNHIMMSDITKVNLGLLPLADVVIGGPPCQSFSLAGKRDVEDERGQLIWSYINIIKHVAPKAFVFENVTGLLSARNSHGKKIVDLLSEAFKDIGYTINMKTLNAADYGVPQRRKRVFIVGVIGNEKFVFPEPTHSVDGVTHPVHVTVSEALNDLPYATVAEQESKTYNSLPLNDYQKRMRNGNKGGITEHIIPKMSELDEFIISHIKPGGNYMDVPRNVDSKRIRRLQEQGGHTTCYGRLSPSLPSYTINTHFNRPNVGCNIHYEYDRLITVREALRLQSFPDTYEVISTSKQGKNMIVGNAVPPLLAEEIAKQLKLFMERSTSMWIQYSDSEVNVYHPFCERALNLAIQELSLENDYKVIHHQYTGTLEMDFVVQNIHTNKYIFVVEVKRTPSDVHSARYQYQAMNYVQMNGTQSEKPFYILTNLEYAFSFRYDSGRSRVFQQMLAPGLECIGNFTDDAEETFLLGLKDFFMNKMKSFIADDFSYLVTLDDFAHHIGEIHSNSKRRKSHLAMLLYEYIRGSFTFLNRRDNLRDVRAFHSDISRICNEAIRINFKDIFSFSSDTFESNVVVDNLLLTNIFDFGKQDVSGDTISGLLHQIVSEGHEHDGEVPTDLELARLVSILAKRSVGTFTESDIICDPAAGSGNLISSAIDTFQLRPTQIFANDINPKLLELLSLRLGLNFASVISPDNSPTISNKNIADMIRDDFDSISVVVMNPPFLAGIGAVERKDALFGNIKRVSGECALTQTGQMPLEAVFLELITELVKEETTIACIFPKTHLVGRGSESVVIRNMLLKKFGLNTVFTFPGDQIFNDVTKDTCVIVGKSKHASASINVISSYDKIPDLDVNRFTLALNANLTDEFQAIGPGLVAKNSSHAELNENVIDGWRTLNSEMSEAIVFVKSYFDTSNKFKKLGELDYTLKRGSAGNSGGSDLLFFDTRDDLCDSFADIHNKLGTGMNNARLDDFVATTGDKKFLDISRINTEEVDRIIDFYVQLPTKQSRQQRLQKSKEDWKKILERESRKRISSNSVFIPRAIRSKGRVYLSKEPMFVSTNFVVCTPNSEDAALVLSTWMSTVFYQLICEVSSKDQEGMRKMEVADIIETLVPITGFISADTINSLRREVDSIQFLDLCNPEVRGIDRIWADELFGDDAEVVLEGAFKLLEYLANRRNI